MTMHVSIGCDPELFCVNGDGVPIPSCGKFGGTKRHPRIIDDKLGLGILEDNVTLEFNLNPAKHYKEFGDNVRSAIRRITGVAREQGLYLRSWASTEFGKDQLEKFKEAMEFGCDPDRDAYDRVERTPPSPKELGNHRCAGQHLHWGYDKEKCEIPDWALVQFLEALVLPRYTNFLTNEYGGALRRKFYGRAGLYREKPYGFEWRTPVGWLNRVKNKDDHFIRDCQYVLTALLNNQKGSIELFEKLPRKDIRAAINNGQGMVLNARWDGPMFDDLYFKGEALVDPGKVKAREEFEIPEFFGADEELERAA